MDSPFLYDQSTPERGHLIIPFQYVHVSGYPVFSYGLLSELGHRGPLHRSINPAQLYSSSVEGIVAIAREHLAQADVQSRSSFDVFQNRYVYQGHLLIVGEIRGKFFYDHYPPYVLRNIAAPKLFATEQECLSWIKLGLQQRPAHP